MPTVMPMILNVYPTPILKEVCDKVVTFGEYLKQIKEQMVALMYMSNGKGIAAPQCGLNARICIVDMGEKEPAVFVNPVWKPTSDVMFSSDEGCLSLPGLKVKNIQRYASIEVTAQDLDGNEFVATFYGANAAAVQHECDHLEGKTILDRIGRIQRDLQLKKYKKIQQKIKLYTEMQDKMK